MKAFRALVRVSMTALLKAIAPGKAGAALSLGLLSGVALLISVLYGGILAVVLAPLGALDLLPGFLCMVGAALAFLFTAFAAGGVLFAGKDNDLLLALPIPDWMLLAARLLALYLENLLVFAMTLLPGMVIYAASGGGVMGLLLAVPVAVFGTLVPTLLAALVGWAITWVSSHTRHNALFANLGYGLLILGIFAASLGANLFAQSTVTEGENLAQLLQGAFTGPMWLFGRMGAACTGDPAAFALTLACSILPAALFVALLQGQYRRLLARMGAHVARKAYRMTAQRSASPMAALLRKEAARFFNTPIYLFNTGFGLFLLVIATVFACWQGERALAWLAAETGMALTGADLYGAAAGTVCMMLATVSTSSVSLSLEGRGFWLLKSLPVPLAGVIRAKVWFNVLAGWPLTAVCIAALWLALGFAPAQGLALLAVSAALSAFVSLGGAAANLLFPRLDAENDTIVCKQSLSAMIGVLGGMALAGAGIGLYLALLSALPLELYLLGCTAVLAVLSLLLARWLATAGVHRLAAMG